MRGLHDTITSANNKEVITRIRLEAGVIRGPQI